MLYLKFFICLLLACYCISKFSFFRKSSLTPTVLVSLFLLKLTAAMLMAYFVLNHMPGATDYEALNNYGKLEFNLMVDDPGTFVKTLFHSGYENKYGAFLSVSGSYWKDLPGTLISKGIAILNVITRGNFYLNTLFFVFIGFLGHVLLFRLFDQIYPGKKNLLIAGSFLIPSTLLFTATIHKDTLVFTSLCLFAWCIFQVVYKYPNTKYVMGMLISLICLVLIRNFMALVLVPMSIAFMLCEKLKWKPLFTYGILIFGGLFLAFILQQTTPLNIFEIISERRMAFQQLGIARTDLPAMQLEPGLNSLLFNFPKAFDHGMLRPYVWQSQLPLFRIFSLEILLVIMLSAWFFIMRKFNVSHHRFTLFMALSALLLIIFIGYVVPNYGSIIRYRSIYLPWIIIPMLTQIKFKNI